MKKLLLSLTFILGTFTLMAQEKVVDITTTHMSVSGPTASLGATRMPALFELYNDSLVMTYTGKAVVKRMEKMGLPVKQVMNHPFTKKSEPYGEVYSYQNEEKKITITIPTKGAKPNIKIQTKDSFSGDVTEQLFISI